MKKFFQALIKKRQKQIDDTRAKIKSSEDVEEVRALGETLTALQEELEDAQAQLDELEDDGDGEGGEGNGEGSGEGGEGERGLNPLASAIYGVRGEAPFIMSNRAERRNLGERFIHEVGEAMQARQKGVQGLSFAAKPWELRDTEDVVATGGLAGGLADMLKTIKPDVIEGYRRPTIGSVFSWEPVTTGSSIEYFVEGAVDGEPETVAEGEQKPQISLLNPTPVTESLRKIAMFMKVTDEYLSDLPRLAARINNRLLYLLALEEEKQLLYGNGTGNNLVGLLGRSGLQVFTSPSYAENTDAVFHAGALVSQESGFSPNAVIVNSVDYEAFRLSKNDISDYYGPGPFAPISQPDIWGVPTIVTPAINQGTVLVGAFDLGATAYRKDGIQVAATNANEDDFIYNRWTIRAEERVALAVERPAAFVKLTLAPKPVPTPPAPAPAP